jgi:hypothetical protein
MCCNGREINGPQEASLIARESSNEKVFTEFVKKLFKNFTSFNWNSSFKAVEPRLKFW